MYCVYDGLTAARLTFEYPTRAQAQHVCDTMKQVRPNAIVFNTKMERKV